MMYELTAQQAVEWVDQFQRLQDQEELPPGPPWDKLAGQSASAISQLLSALGKKKLSAAFRKKYREVAKKQNAQLRSGLPELRSSMVLSDSIEALPTSSFLLQFEFTLEQPMMTRDDVLFTVSDNAVRKDRALGWPHLAGSSWKGCFRAALYNLGHTWELNTDESCMRLLGPWRGKATEGEGAIDFAEKNARRGRLQFYPSMFEKIDFRMLNPQDRVLKSGMVPVELEVVPSKEKSWFQLLYVPFDAITLKKGLDSEGQQLYGFSVEDRIEAARLRREEAFADWRVVARGVSGMLRDFGFGAKVSLGYGLAENVVRVGKLVVASAEGVVETKFERLDQLESIVPGGLE